MRGLLLGAALLALLALGASTATASPVQQFVVQLKDIRPDGRFSIVFSGNSFDTTGAPPPALTDASVRLSKGITIKPRFLAPARLCETGKLRGILLKNERPGLGYNDLLSDLGRASRRIGPSLSPLSRQILNVCRRSFVGQGRFLLDARPLFADAIPGSLFVFLAQPTAKGALAGFGVMSMYDKDSVVARNEPLIAYQQPVFTVNIFDDPTPDGIYGYRLRLRPENVGRLPFSLAELRVESPGIRASTRRRTCVSRRAGRCVKYAVRYVQEFWAGLPTCPASGRLQFKADFRYVTGLHTTDVLKVPCPRYRR